MIQWSFDTETHLFYPGNMTPPIVCGSWTELNTPACLELRDVALNQLEDRLHDRTIEIIGAHIAYDFACASAARPHLLPLIFKAYEDGRVFDISIAEALYDIFYGQLFVDPVTRQPFYRYKQDLIERRLLGIDRSAVKDDENAWRRRYKELDGVPISQWPPEAVQYPKDDVDNALACAVIQKGRSENIHHQSEQARAAWALYLSSVWGIRTDAQIVEEVAAEIEKGHLEALARFSAVGLFRENGKKDTSKLMRLVAEAYGAKEACAECAGTGKGVSQKTGKPVNCSSCQGAGLNLDTVPQTPSGRVSTDEDTLKNSNNSVLVDFSKIGENEKFFSTYLPIIRRGAQAPINPEINILVETGRTSYRNPNLQNQPRNGRIRECYCAREGRLFCSCDYSTLELVTLAQVCIWYVGRSNMAEAINAGQDLHDQFAAQVRNLSYAEQHAATKAGDKTAKNYRQMAKCFHPDTEILTPQGWQRIADLTMDTEVAAAIPEGDGVRIEWQLPKALTRRPCPEGSLIHLKNEGMDLRVTADHRMLVRRANGKYAVVTPEEVPKAREWMNAGTLNNLGGVEVSERLLRLAVAVQADGNYREHGNKIRLGFSKQRKIDRLKSLLLEDEYTIAKYTNGKVEKLTTCFSLSPELSDKVKDLLDNKRLPWWWLKLTPRCREIVLDEFRFWDGSQASNWRMASYSTTLKQNADVLQALASITGRKTRAVWTPRSGEKSDCCKLTVRAQGRDRTRGENLSVERIQYEGDVVCLSVPSSFVLVRDGGVPVVTGQCANFGLPGGLGPSALVGYARAAYDARLCVLSGRSEVCGQNMTKDRSGNPICKDCLDVARGLRSEWFKKWDEVAEYHDIIKANTEGPLGGPVVVPGVEPHPGLGLTRGGCFFTDGANTGFQGLAARGAKAAVFEVSKECYTVKSSPLYGTRPVVFIHDEIIAEVPADERRHAAAFRMSKVMVDAMRVFTPDVAVKCEPALMKHWFKGSEAIYGCEIHPKQFDGKCCDKALLWAWEPCSSCKGSGKVKSESGEKVKCGRCAGKGFEPPQV